MKTETIGYLNNTDELFSDGKKHVEISLPDNKGQIVVCHPFDGMQIIFYDMNSAIMPDLWEAGIRKGDDERYFRILVCKNGKCSYVVRGNSGEITQGQAMIDYYISDDRTFNFECEAFTGIEVAFQADTLLEESVVFKMLKLVVDSMNLPMEEISDSKGYVLNYSSLSGEIISKLLKSGFSGEDEVRTVSLALDMAHSLGVDIKNSGSGIMSKTDRKKMIAADIYRTLTEDFGTKYTADYFAKKYGVSDTTVKKYFKSVYGYGFKEYQVKVRMEWASEKLRDSDMMMGEISDAIGYSKQTKFSKAFKDYYGVTPREYRSNSILQNDKY